MTPYEPLKLVCQLLDLPLIDCEGRYCGIVDDVEFSGAAGKPAALKALLVGPGAYRGRLPRWALWLVAKLAGTHMARVPVDKIESIGALVHLKCRAEQVGLHRVEDRFRHWVPRRGAL